MSRVCELTGKKAMFGNKVSHSNSKTRRRFYPNLQDKKFYIPELKKTVALRISTKAMRTIDKKGIYNFIMELEKKGKKIL
ncbi:MAG: 50S ribosomal protein L28 [Bacteroidia bacterium]